MFKLLALHIDQDLQVICSFAHVVEDFQRELSTNPRPRDFRERKNTFHPLGSGAFPNTIGWPISGESPIGRPLSIPFLSRGGHVPQWARWTSVWPQVLVAREPPAILEMDPVGLRKCLAKWGYSANDVKVLFEFVDTAALKQRQPISVGRDCQGFHGSIGKHEGQDE